MKILIAAVFLIITITANAQSRVVVPRATIRVNSPRTYQAPRWGVPSYSQSIQPPIQAGRGNQFIPSRPQVPVQGYRTTTYTRQLWPGTWQTSTYLQ